MGITRRENYFLALEHKKTPFVPVYESIHLKQIGFMDPFEKGGPTGGIDGFGVEWVPTASADGAVVPTHRVTIMEDILDWRDVVKFPDLDAIDWQAKAEKDLAGFDRIKEDRVFEYGMGNGHFERLCDLMGIANALCAMLEEPEAVAEYMEAYTEYRIRLVDKIAKYYSPDCICNYDDVATATSTFMHPDIYRELISPGHKAVNDAIKSHGIIPIQHCCGKAEGIIEDFIAEGAAGWTSIQPSNDIAGMIEKYGDRYTFIGGFDSNGIPGSRDASLEERIADIHRAIDTYAGKGSYIIGNINILTGDMDKTNMIMDVLTREADRYGRSINK